MKRQYRFQVGDWVEIVADNFSRNTIDGGYVIGLKAIVIDSTHTGLGWGNRIYTLYSVFFTNEIKQCTFEEGALKLHRKRTTK